MSLNLETMSLLELYDLVEEITAEIKSRTEDSCSIKDDCYIAPNSHIYELKPGNFSDWLCITCIHHGLDSSKCERIFGKYGKWHFRSANTHEYDIQFENASDYRKVIENLDKIRDEYNNSNV